MTKELVQLTKVGKTEKQQRQSPNSHKYSEVRTREHLLPQEVEAMRSAIKQSKGRHAHRDSTLMRADLPSRIASVRGSSVAMGANRL